MKMNKREEYKIKHHKSYYGRCPPGYEKISGYSKKDGTKVEDHCRKITVKGKTKTLFKSGYNEAQIGFEDVFLGFDTVTDRTKHGELETQKIQKRSKFIETLMHDQEERKSKVKDIERH